MPNSVFRSHALERALKKKPEDWVHISCLPPGYGDNRHSELSYIYNPEDQRYVYVNGLQVSAIA